MRARDLKHTDGENKHRKMTKATEQEHKSDTEDRQREWLKELKLLLRNATDPFCKDINARHAGLTNINSKG